MAAALLSLALAAAALPWGTAEVAAVTVEAAVPVDRDRLSGLIAIEPGAPLDRLEVRHAVQALIASGEVEDVSVDAVPEGDGRRFELVFHVQPASRVGSFEIDGLPRRGEKRVRRALRVVPGEPFHLPVFLRELRRIQARVRAEGHPDAVLEPELDFGADNRVRVVVHGTLGPARTVAKLEAPGAGLTAAEVWKASGLQPGQVLGDADVERARRGLVQRLRADGWWTADTGRPSVSGDGSDVTVVVPVELGPRYTLDLAGIELSRAMTAEAFPFVRGDEPFEDVALDAFVRRLRVFLQTEGRLLARVDASVTRDGSGAETLHVVVEDAARRPIEAVRFPGLAVIDPAALRDRIGARPGRPWRWGREPVNEDTLAADRLSVEATLEAEGFAQASVGDAVIVPEGSGVAIEFPVELGLRMLTGDVVVKGLPEGVDRPELPLVPGGAWSPGGLERSVAVLRAVMEDAGYPDVQVSSEHECAEALCSAELDVDAGRRVEVGRVVIAGLARTRPEVVRAVAGIEPGETFAPTEQLEAQRRLLGLGIFERVSVRPVPGQRGGERRGVLLDLEEGPSRALGFGLGYDTEEQVRVSVTWSELNLFGTGRSLAFEGRISSRERRAQISFREPARLGIRGFPTWVSVYRTEEDYASFSLLRRGMWVEIGDRQRRPARFLLRYDYQIVDNNAPDEILSELEREQQSLAIASITPILEWDTRDDLFSPRRGVFATVSLQTAFKAFIADAPFEKVTAGVSAFHPVGASVVAGSVRAGGIQPWGGRREVLSPCSGLPASGLDNLQVPVNVRFFAGGRVSQRAFPTDRLGIPCETLDANGGPVGGAGLLLASAELRFPIFGAVNGELFVDGGNVWPAWQDIAPSQMRWGGGVGLRVETPVGPLRLEYGWKFDRRVGESPGELFLSLGNPF